MAAAEAVAMLKASGFFVIFCALLLCVRGQAAQDVRLYVDPDVRITYDGDVPHMESPMVASVTDPNLLFVGTEVLYPGRSFIASSAQIYYSNDAGVRWTPVLLPLEIARTWDNTMAAAPDGTVYFITHNYNNGLTVYRTSDGGKSWAHSFINSHPNWDREYAVADTTSGRYSGRLYVAGEGYLRMPRVHKGVVDTRIDPSNKDGVKVVSSSNGGRTFSPPVMACHRDGWAAGAENHPVVLSDGTLVVPCTFYPVGAAMFTSTLREFGVATSSDGGKTFSPFHLAGVSNIELLSQRTRQFLRGDLLPGGIYNAELAVAPTTGIHPNRLYITWPTFDTPNREVIYVAHSDNRGVAWSKRVAVDAVTLSSRGMIRQGFPTVAVDRNGVVGIAWHDGRNAAGARGYDIYFAASLNGGASFLPPVRVSSMTSYPREDTTINPVSSDSDVIPGAPPSAGDVKSINFMSPYDLRWLGGDFSTMTVDAAGRFHAMWQDAREGTWQLYTSTIRVVPPVTAADSAQSARSCPMTRNVRLLLGVARWNAAAKEVSVPVQLENITNDTYVNPLVVRVVGVRDPYMSFDPNVVAQFPMPLVFDPNAHGYRSYANIDYPVSADRPLFPYGVTVRKVWRFHVDEPEQIQFTSHMTITGFGSDCH